ncbi:MAG TPA: sigma-70 family RNA polymerase sigma factor [Acidimicrobiales bacterium]
MWTVSDEALFAGYAAGDPQAAAVFVQRFENQVYGLARAMAGAPAEAEEIAQEAFVRAWKYAASFDERRGSVAAWLLRVTRNVALDHLRARGRRAEPVGELPADLIVDPADVGETVDRHDDVARVAGLLRGLPEAQREALVAVTLLGLTTREVSEAAAVPQATVKTRIRLALRKLRDELGADAR